MPNRNYKRAAVVLLTALLGILTWPAGPALLLILAGGCVVGWILTSLVRWIGDNWELDN